MSEQETQQPDGKFTRLLKAGVEMLSQIPVTIPVHIKRQKSMNQRLIDIKNFSLEHQAQIYAAQNGLETYEESLDFDEENDPLEDIETPEEYAAAQAMNYGAVQKPSQERLDGLKETYKRKPKPKPSEPPINASE